MDKAERQLGDILLQISELRKGIDPDTPGGEDQLIDLKKLDKSLGDAYYDIMCYNERIKSGYYKK